MLGKETNKMEMKNSNQVSEKEMNESQNVIHLNPQRCYNRSYKMKDSLQVCRDSTAMPEMKNDAI